MKTCFKPHTFYSKARDLITACNVICITYVEKGYTLTLRQLFYQLVSTNKIANTDKEYKLLGKTVTDARYAGELDWEHITDRVRVITVPKCWTDVRDGLTFLSDTFNIDTLKRQKYRPEVWIEKDALIELAANVCGQWDIPYIAVKAYSSASALWEAKKRFDGYLSNGQVPIILHLGDHDCTGVDCSRFLQETMTLMVYGPDSNYPDPKKTIELRRLALNPDQIAKHELPPQPGKTKDPRFKGYLEAHKTDYVWELDALAPDVIEKIIEDGISKVIDTPRRAVFLNRLTDYKNEIMAMAENYDVIVSDGFKTWAGLQDTEHTEVTPNLGIPLFQPISVSKPRLFAAEMDAETAKQYLEALWPKNGLPKNPLSFWSNWSKLP